MSKASSLFRKSRLPIAVAVLVIGATSFGAFRLANASTGASSTFQPVTPWRVLETRSGEVLRGVASAAPIGADSTIDVQITGNVAGCGTDCIPAGATGVVLNVTVVGGTQSSFLTIFPAGQARPVASNLNWTAGQAPTPNLVTVQLGTGGKISLYNKIGTVDVAADVAGFYVAAGQPGALGYQVVTKAGTAPASGFLFDTVLCPAGKVPIGGGAIATSSPVFGTNRMVQSGIVGNGWLVDIENTGGTATGYTIQAICATVS